jgi:hypothetical protein
LRWADSKPADFPDFCLGLRHRVRDHQVACRVEGGQIVECR